MQERAAGDPPRAPVPVGGVAHAALRHGGLPELQVDQHDQVARTAAGDRPRAQRPLARDAKLGAQVVEQAQAVLGHRAHGGLDGFGVGDARVGGYRRAAARGVERFATVEGDCAEDQVVIEPEVRIPNRAVVGRRRRRVLEMAPGLGEAAGQGEGGAAHEGEPRLHGDGFVAKLAVGLDEAVDALVQPEPQSARVDQDPANQLRVVRGRRVAHGGHRLAAPRQRNGDAPLHRSVALRGRAPPVRDAVVADQRMQTIDARTPRAHGFEQTGEAGHALEALDRPGALERLVEQFAVDAVEEAHIEQELAVLRGEMGPHPRLDPAGDDVLHEPPLAGRGAVAAGAVAVAVHAHGDRPAAGLRGHRGEALARQRQIEEAGDLGRREAQVLGEQYLRGRVEHGGGDIEPRRQFAAGQRQVQVGRRGRPGGGR